MRVLRDIIGFRYLDARTGETKSSLDLPNGPYIEALTCGHFHRPNLFHGYAKQVKARRCWICEEEIYGEPF